MRRGWRARHARAVDQPRAALGLEPAPPPPRGRARDTHLRRDMRDRATSSDPPHHDQPAGRSQPGISVGHERPPLARAGFLDSSHSTRRSLATSTTVLVSTARRPSSPLRRGSGCSGERQGSGDVVDLGAEQADRDADVVGGRTARRRLVVDSCRGAGSPTSAENGVPGATRMPAASRRTRAVRSSCTGSQTLMPSPGSIVMPWVARASRRARRRAW